MKRALVVAVTLLFVSSHAAAQERAGRLRNASPDIAAKYEALRALGAEDVQAEWVQLSPAVKRGIWTLHLTQFLDDHPELTAEQRGVIFEALGVTGSGAYEVDPRSPEYAAHVLEPMRQLHARAKALLPRELVREAFLQLGPGGGLSGGRRFQVTVQETCHCRTGTDDCGPGIPCIRPTPRYCTFYYACGPMFTEGCNGLCY